MGKSAPSAPKPPDPAKTAAAQAAANKETAIAQRDLNLISQVTPQGSLTYTYGGTAPGSGVRLATATQTLSPAEQAVYDADVAARQGLGAFANQQLGAVSQSLSSPFDIPGSAPGRVDSINMGGAPGMQYNFSDAGPIARSLDFTNLGDPNITRNNVEAGLMARLNPYLDRDRAALETRLANQGIALGSDAYKTGIDESNRVANDARLGVIERAGAEQSRLFGLGMDQANFGNQAQQQQFMQELSRAGLSNSAIAQFFNQQQNAGAFQNQQRQNAITEALLKRQTPLNEINAFMSGSQVMPANFVNTPGTPVAPTDVAGPTALAYQGNLAAWQQQQANRNAMMGGLFGLGGAGLTGWLSR